MVKSLKRVGNSNAIILDQAILELVGLEENGKVQISLHEGSILLTPVRPHRVDPERLEAALNRVVRKRRSVLRRLAQ